MSPVARMLTRLTAGLAICLGTQAWAGVTVSLTAPANGSEFGTGVNITLSATASANQGYTVSKVEFFQGTTLIGTDTTAPYSIVWNSVPAGNYSLTAKATAIKKNSPDQTATSAAVNISVGPLLHFIHVDHLNTPRLVANQQGQTVWRWDQQEPFGNNPADENPSGLGTFDLPLRLPGQYYDKETNLFYNYFRDYDPSLGRYAESDPIGLRDGLNTYAYVRGNPLSLVDPEGLKALICCRVLNSFILGRVLRQRHCYFNVDGTTYGLYPEGNIGVPRVGASGDRGGICHECKPLPCSDVNQCIANQSGNYPVGSYNAVYGPNSNTYAATIARACCAGGFPAGSGDAPGIGDLPPAPIP